MWVFVNEARRCRLGLALLKRGTKTRFAKAAGKSAESVRSWLAGETAPTFDAITDGCAALGISLDWIAYGTRAPAVDEGELAKAITYAEGYLSGLTPLDRARAIHLIYMRALEHPAAPYGRSELLRILGVVV